MEPKEKETVVPNVIILPIGLHLDVPFANIFVAFVQIAWSSRETFRIAGTVLAFYYSGKLPSLYAIYASMLPALPVSRHLQFGCLLCSLRRAPEEWIT